MRSGRGSTRRILSSQAAGDRRHHQGGMTRRWLRSARPARGRGVSLRWGAGAARSQLGAGEPRAERLTAPAWKDATRRTAARRRGAGIDGSFDVALHRAGTGRGAGGDVLPCAAWPAGDALQGQVLICMSCRRAASMPCSTCRTARRSRRSASTSTALRQSGLRPAPGRIHAKPGDRRRRAPAGLRRLAGSKRALGLQQRRAVLREARARQVSVVADHGPIDWSEWERHKAGVSVHTLAHACGGRE